MAYIDTTTVIPRLLGLFVTYVVATVIYRLNFHPLANFNGPLIGRLSSYYKWRAMFKQDESQKHQELLRKYGSPVRIAPNELIFSDMKSFTDIYGQSSNPCMKDPKFYDVFTITGALNILNAKDKGQHARFRRILNHGFSLKEILQSESMIADKIETLVELVFIPACGGPAVDVHDKIHELFLDVISHLSFGKSFEALEGKGDFTNDKLEHFLNMVPLNTAFPPLKYLPITYIQEGQEGLAKLQKFSRDAIQECMDKIEKDDDGVSHSAFLEKLIMATDPETGSKLSMEELSEHAMLFLIAGSGTTAVTVIMTLWHCGRRPEIRRKLVQEIRETFPDPEVMPTYEVASKLPYLNAVIEESLRLHGPLSTSLPRISPGRIIGEHFVPTGTTVSTATTAAARDGKVFPDPENYKPERWLDATPDMRNMSRPFSLGPRNCIGQHLAKIDLVLVLSRLFQLFDITVDSSMTEEMMRPRERAVIGVRDEKLLLNVRSAGSK